MTQIPIRLHGQRRRGRLIQLQIAVTAEDIKYARRAQTDRCPIARAIARRFGVLSKDIDVDFERVRIGKRLFLMSFRGEVWMSAFDAGKRVKPTWFLFDEVRA